jgi:PPOX class probable F420-dependent enzyme
MSPRRSTALTDAEFEAYLDQVRTGVLTTLGPNGYPHSTAMWFAASDSEILMWTYAKSQKAVNLSRDPRCCFLIEDGMAYAELRGVLVTGDARTIEDHDEIAAIGLLLYERYTQPSTGIPAEDGPIVEIQRQATKRIGIALALESVTSWDHRKL